MKHLNRIFVAALVCVMLCLLVCPAFAAVEVDAGCSLYVDFKYEMDPIVGARFRLYRVADMDNNKNVTFTGIFANTILDLEDPDGSALQLAIRVEAENAPADMILTTDEEGMCGTKALRPGAYLLMSEPAVQDQRTHYTDPQLVILPYESEADGTLNYHVVLRPKSTECPASAEPIDVTVVKVWEDKGYESNRPTSITVHLIRNDKQVDTVVLSEKNQWTHTWSGLIPTADWSVEEDVPNGYICETKEWINVFTLTNYRKDIDQTGHIWWPVAVLLGVGFTLVIAGILLRRSGKHEA